MVAALEARVKCGLRRLEALAAVVREGWRPRIAATGSVELSCGSLVLWTAAGGSDESVGLSSRKTSISDMLQAEAASRLLRLQAT